MATVTVDFVARGPDDAHWSMVLVEQGPWSHEQIDTAPVGAENQFIEYLEGLGVVGLYLADRPESDVRPRPRKGSKPR